MRRRTRIGLPVTGVLAAGMGFAGMTFAGLRAVDADTSVFTGYTAGNTCSGKSPCRLPDGEQSVYPTFDTRC